MSSEAPANSLGPGGHSGALKRTLGPVMLWGLGVGYVISGEYFGWNLGLAKGGTWGMLAATLLVTVLYVAFVLSYAELACALPGAGAAFVYSNRAFGGFGGFCAGAFQFVEFVFAPPAIALAIGAYLQTFLPAADARVLALGAYVLLTGLNIWGVKQAAYFEFGVTLIAVAELIIFIAVTAGVFKWENVTREALPFGWWGAFGAIPFAIWFYLAIEGVANAAEEARNPQRDIAIGFTASIITLVVLALGVFFTAVGAGGWRAIVYVGGGTEMSDKPLPLAMAFAVDQSSPLFAMLVGIGLFGLVASFHGILLAAGRATFALGRAGYAPALFAVVHPRTGTPIAALLGNMVIGAIAVLSGKTDFIIIIAVFGALGLYVISMAALFKLRRSEPTLARPFKAIGYPVLPTIALVLSVVCFVATAISYPWPTLAFATVMGVGFIYYFAFGRDAAKRLALNPGRD